MSGGSGSPVPTAAGPVQGFESVRERLGGVEGWLTDAQAQRLFARAAGLRAPARIVEIGSFRGRSTIVLASAASEGVDVVAIDPHGGGDRGPQEITPDAQQGVISWGPRSPPPWGSMATTSTPSPAAEARTMVERPRKEPISTIWAGAWSSAALANKRWAWASVSQPSTPSRRPRTESKPWAGAAAVCT